MDGLEPICIRIPLSSGFIIHSTNSRHNNLPFAHCCHRCRKEKPNPFWFAPNHWWLQSVSRWMVRKWGRIRLHSFSWWIDVCKIYYSTRSVVIDVRQRTDVFLHQCKRQCTGPRVYRQSWIMRGQPSRFSNATTIEKWHRSLTAFMHYWMLSHRCSNIRRG